MRSLSHYAKPLRIERFEDRRLLSAVSPAELLLAIHNPTPNADDHFGAAVAAVGDKVLVGAPQDDTFAGDGGIAYLFDTTTGGYQTFPNPEDHSPLTSDCFGASVAALGDNVLIGAPLADDGVLNAGAVYLFDGTSGELLRTFRNPEPDKGDQFGATMLAIGDDVLIAAPFDSGDAQNAGSVYLFDGQSGELLQKFTQPTSPSQPTPAVGGQFGGNAVVLDADHILIAAPPLETVFLLGRDQETSLWDLERTVANPEQQLGEQFGYSLAVAGDQVFVGAVFDGTYGRNAGIGYQFDTSTVDWTWRRIPDSQNPSGPTIETNDYFGVSAAAVGNGFLVGSSQPYTGPGIVYWFDSRTGGVATIENPEADPGDQFGLRLAALGNELIVAAPFDDTGAKDSGSVYIFRQVDPSGDNPPTISDIADQTIYEDGSTGPLDFTVDDPESDPAALAVTAQSSDTTRIPNANLILGGSGANRTIEVVSAADQNGGPVTITISVGDGTNVTVESFDVEITAVNDAPSFTIGPDQEVPEDSGPQSAPGFALGISAGPPDESGQALSFVVSTNNPDLFAVQPAINAATGELTYTPALDASGVAAVMVQLADDGGTAGGGVDTSPALAFTIRVLSEQQQVENVLDQIANLSEAGILNGGQTKSLSGKLEKVAGTLDKDQPKTAVNQLHAFVNQIEALVEGGILSPEQGQSLIDAAEALANSITIEDLGQAAGAAQVDAALTRFEPVHGPFGHK